MGLVEIHGHGIVLDTGGDWEIADGWHAAALQAIHGVYLRHRVHDLQMNVRAESAAGRELTEHGLRVVLAQQQWASPPYDVRVTRRDGLVVVAGSFDAGRPPVVRELFVTDGQRLANAALPGARDQVEAASEAAERLLATVRFAAAMPPAR